MVAKLTHGVRKFEGVQAHMEKAIPVLHELFRQLIPMIDADTSAFNEYMEGVRMAQSTEEEKAARGTRMQAGLKTAIQVPLTTMRLADKAWNSLCEVARYGNPASSSDTLVGARALETGIWGAYQNVLINMTDIQDAAFREEVLSEAEKMVARAAIKRDEVLKILSA